MLRHQHKLRYLFARTIKSKNITNYDEIQQMRQYLVEKVSPHYTFSDRPHEDTVYEESLYGRKCHIAGLTPNSQNSATYIRSICRSINPDIIILGNYNSSRLISQKIAKQVRNYDTVTQPSKLYCKSLISPMLPKLTQLNENYITNEQNGAIYKFDHYNKHFQALNYITILNRAIHHQYSKLLFGLPSDYIIFEDLMLNRSIQELRYVFNKVVNVVKKNADQYGNEVFSTNYYPEIVAEQLRYKALFEPLLTQKQTTYATALLNYVVKNCQRVLIFVPNNHVQQISQNVHKTTIDPKQIFRSGYSHDNLQQFINNKNSESGMKLSRYLDGSADDKIILRQQVIQKFVILNYLKNHTLEQELVHDDINVFEKTVFRGLFQGVKFGELRDMHRKIKEKYVEKVGEIIQHRIGNLKYYKQPQKNFYTLTQMIKTQQQRNQDFPMSLAVENKQSQLKLQNDMKELLGEMQRMAREQLNQSDKQLMESFKNGHRTRENIVLFQKLLVQAKIRLKKRDIKLPIFHYGMMAEIFKDQIKSSIFSGKSQKDQLMSTIEKLKEKGSIRELKDEQELEKLLDSDIPRISINFDENGGVSVHDDSQLAINLEKVAKKNKIVQEMLEMSKKATEDDVVYEEDDEMNKNLGGQIREGRRIKKKGSNKNK